MKSSRADKWYALMWCYVCPLTWLKMIKLCPCLSHFSSFSGHFESLAFSKMGGQTLYQSSQTWYFSQFLKDTTIKWQFFKRVRLFWPKTEDKPNSRYLSKVFSTKNWFIVEKLWLFGLNSGDKGDNIDMWMIKITIKANQPIKLIWMFCLFQK